MDREKHADLTLSSEGIESARIIWGEVVVHLEIKKNRGLKVTVDSKLSNTVVMIKEN